MRQDCGPQNGGSADTVTSVTTRSQPRVIVSAVYVVRAIAREGQQRGS